MDFLTLEEVLNLYSSVMSRTGGAAGVLNLGALESALAQPYATFDQVDLYPTLPEKAAATAHSIIANHPFIDGNKRIGHAVLETTLVLNGCELAAHQDEQEKIILRVASGDMDRQEFSMWVKANMGPKA